MCENNSLPDTLREGPQPLIHSLSPTPHPLDRLLQDGNGPCEAGNFPGEVGNFPCEVGNLPREFALAELRPPSPGGGRASMVFGCDCLRYSGGLFV